MCEYVGQTVTAGGREDFEQESICMLELFADDIGEKVSVWWSDGSDKFNPRFTIVLGVPSPDRFVKLLEDGA